MIFTFKKPYIFEGKTYTEFSLPDDLSGYDIMKVKADFAKKGTNALAVETLLTTNLDFLLMFAARFSALPEEFFLRMPAGLFMWSMDQVTLFFTRWDSNTSQTSGSSVSAQPLQTPLVEAH